MAEPRAYGCIPDEPDANDQMFAVCEHVDLAALPPMVDLRAGIPSPPFNQLRLGSCTGQAISRLFEFTRHKLGLEHFVPSRLFIYWFERSMEGTINQDAGAQIRDGLKVLDIYGACPEEDWPYDITKFRQEPSVKAQANALIHRAIDYQRVNVSVDQMKGTLAAGFPFAFGIKVYPSFEGEQASKTGVIPMPNARRERTIGGHAVFACGYDDTKQVFIGENSWGPNWGDHGFFYIPYHYIGDPNLCSDCWTLHVGV